MKDKAVVALRKRIEYKGSAELTRSGGRQAIVELWLKDGSHLRHHTPVVQGAWENPMTRKDVDEKCFDLIAGVVGSRKARTLLDNVWRLDRLPSVRPLRPLLQG